MAIVEDCPRGRPEMKVRMLDVCNRKVQEHVTVKEAHKTCKRLFDEYGQRALLAESSEGVDWKAMMHATRVCREAEELLLTHTIFFPRPEARLLPQIRKGGAVVQAVGLLEAGMERLKECQRLSTPPEAPVRAFAEGLVVGAFRGKLGKVAA